MKIIIADDSSFMRNILKTIVLRGGWPDAEILEARNGNEALMLFGVNQPDLMLLDMIMPEKEGIEVIKEIGDGAKIIVVSAVGQENIIQDAKNFGAKAFINKPFDKTKVIETMKAVLSS